MLTLSLYWDFCFLIKDKNLVFSHNNIVKKKVVNYMEGPNTFLEFTSGTSAVEHTYTVIAFSLFLKLSQHF